MPRPDPNIELRRALVEGARLWIGTPVIHQHRIMGFGVDCWNLMRGVGEAAGVLEVTEKRFEPFRAYGRQPSPRLVLGAMTRFYKPVRSAEPKLADIALIEWRPGLTMHLAMLAEFDGRPTLIHALERKGKVVEHGFTAEWPGLVNSWWRFPGIRGR